MSKMDDMRAMREARYQRAGATPPRDGEGARTTRTSRSAPVAPDTATPGGSAAPAKKTTARTKAAPAAASADGAAAPAVEGLCGHRAISGRTCTREQGHAAKSHRYS